MAVAGEIPRQRDQEREQQISDRESLGRGGADERRQALAAAERAPRPEHEDELPGERVEHPLSARIRRHVPVELPAQGVERHRCGERNDRQAPQQPEQRRESDQQDDVERQDVHAGGLELEQQRLDQRHVRLLEEIEDAHLLGVERIVEASGHIGDFRHVDHEQENMRGVDLPGAAQDPGRGQHEAALVHRPAVDERRRIAGDEYEDLGGVAEAVVADGDPADRVRGNMIEKDQPERQPAKQIEPHVALGGDGGGRTVGPAHRRRRDVGGLRQGRTRLIHDSEPVPGSGSRRGENKSRSACAAKRASDVPAIASACFGRPCRNRSPGLPVDGRCSDARARRCRRCSSNRNRTCLRRSSIS